MRVRRRRAAPPAARALAGTAARPARPAPRPATRPYRSCRSWHSVAAQPDPNEAAQLMTQEHDARQGGRIAQAVDLPDQPLRQRHRAQPEQSHPGGEDVQHPRRQRQPEQQQDTEGAHAVDHGEQALLAVLAAQLAGIERTQHVEQADQRNRGGPCAAVRPPSVT